MSNAGMYNLTSSDGLVAQAGLGDEIDIGGCRFGYFKCNASALIAAFSACTIADAYVAAVATTTTSGSRPTLFCIPQFAVAVSEYFWAPIGPFGEATPYNDPATGVPVTFKVLAAASCATDVKLYTTATDGVVDDSATDLITGLLLSETITGAEAADCISVMRMTSNTQD